MNLLAAIAIGFLVLDPEQMFDASFQLSFGAVAFIAAFAVPLVERTSGPLRKGFRDLAGPGAATCTWNRAPPNFAWRRGYWRRRCACGRACRGGSAWPSLPFRPAS